MRLEHARLCLDCEEIHEDQECPACGSEAFAFLTRWIKTAGEPLPRRGAAPAPAGNERKPEAPRQTSNPEQVDAWRRIIEGNPEPRRHRLLGSLIGLTAMGVAGWAWSRKKKDDTDTPTDE